MFAKKKTEGGTGSTVAGAAAETVSQPHPDAVKDPQAPKGVPTPSRREREAARKRPLVSNDPKEARRRRREAEAERGAKMRKALETGDDRYMPVKHRGENRRFLRAFVDRRFRFSETLLFVTLAFLIVSMSFGANPAVSTMIAYLFYAYFAIVVVEQIIMNRLMRREQAAKGLVREPGDAWYVIERSMMFSRLRLPKKGV